MSLGQRIRQRRKSQKQTLVELAKQCGISPSFLSQVERDQANPSIGTLQSLAHALGLTMATFFEEPGQREDSPQPGETLAAVVRADRRKLIIYPGSGTRHELLSPDLQRKIQMTWIVMPPGADTGDVPFLHEGEECGIVLQGKVEARIGDERYVLSSGDAIYHASDIPHGSRNIGDDDAIMIVASTPPSF
jgi:transcriptional regulator with XRE-family HTH domain